jgi:hypothetical protein
MAPLSGGPATTLDDLYRTMRPDPLTSADELKQYYRGEVNQVRGEDTVLRLSRKLQQSFGALPFKAFLMGHPGVGKSTEITRLLERVKDQQVGVRLSVATELNPASFKIFDVLLLVLARLTEEANKLNAIPLGGVLSAKLVSDIEQWFSTEQVKSTSAVSTATGVDAGAGIKDNSLWAGLLGLFASVKTEMKYAADRKKETVEYRLKRLPELVDFCNKLIEVCSQTLLDKNGKEWIIVVEDLDKIGISAQQLQELFIQYGTVFQDLRINMIFTIPVWLAYSADANRLPFERHMIHDTPVYNKMHEPHTEGRSAVRAVLEARVAPALFADDLMDRMIVASGGNLRDLFSLVYDAGERALLHDPGAKAILANDAAAAIANLRKEYKRRLGQSPYDAQPIPYAQKSEKLLAVYNGASDSDVPDPALYSLLRGRSVQEFNGDGWYGVHPLVVDILKDQDHLKPQDSGGTS